jgi:hypothetical protein
MRAYMQESDAARRLQPPCFRAHDSRIPNARTNHATSFRGRRINRMIITPPSKIPALGSGTTLNKIPS